MYGAGTLHVKSTINHVINYFFDFLPFAGLVSVIHDAGMEVAVANVSENTGEHAEIIEFFLGDF